MSPPIVALISFAVIFGSTMLGMVVRRLLPEHHLRDDSKDTVKLGAGLIATLAALVLGLLVGSAKSSFDAVNAGITQAAAKAIVLDRALARYGPEAKDAREQLRRSVAGVIEMIWPDQRTGVSGLTALERANGLETLQDKVQALQPASDSQRALLSRALDLTNDVGQARWLLIEQQHVGLPTALLVVLVLWLAILYASFGLFAPRNATVILVLFVCALSASASLFLILELNSPLEGTIKVSSAPMVKALELLGR
jgi:hypothetical protein